MVVARIASSVGQSWARCATVAATTVSGTGLSANSSGGASTGSNAKADRSARRPGAITPATDDSPAAAAAWVV